MQTYQNMKDSGVAWLGDVPSEWNIYSVKWILDRKIIKNKSENPVVLSLARAGVKIRDIATNEGQLAESYLNYNVVSPGNVLLNPMDLISGANCSISKVNGVISPAYVNLQPKRDYSSRYFDYYFKLQYWSKAFFVHGKGVSYNNRWTLSVDTILNYPVPVPDSITQKRIADYLDKETAKIDNLISKQENLLKLLEEKRRATLTIEIERTDITKIPFKRFIQYLGRGASPDYDEKGSTVFINQACIYWQGLDLRGIKHAKSLSHKSGGRGSLQYGDLLLNSTGTGTLGRAAIFNKNGLNYFADSHVTIIRPQKSKLNSKYLKYLIESDGLQDQIYKLCVSGSTNQIELSKERFANLFVSVPSIDEQTLIVQRLDMLYDKIELIRTHTLAQISLLKERRVSLISNVVTGKVRV